MGKNPEGRLSDSGVLSGVMTRPENDASLGGAYARTTRPREHIRDLIERMNSLQVAAMFSLAVARTYSDTCAFR